MIAKRISAANSVLWPAQKRVGRFCLAAIAVALLFATAVPERSQASLGIWDFTVQPEANAMTQGLPQGPFQAGAHPDLHIFQDFCEGLYCTLAEQEDDLKDIRLSLPAGLLGNPRATPLCKGDDLEADRCPPTTVIGTLSAVGTAEGGGQNAVPAWGEIYNVEPLGSEAARLGIVTRQNGQVAAPPSVTSATVRSTDLGVDSVTLDLPRWAVNQAVRVHAVDLMLCGSVPPAPLPVMLAPPPACQPAAGLAQTPFITNPTSCPASGVTTTLAVNSYDDPGTFATANDTFFTEGCDQVPFSPTIDVAPDTNQPGVPSGYTIGINFPESEGAPIHQAHLNRAEVTLPQGVTVSTGAASGLEGCTEAEFGLGTDSPARCPADSDIADVEVETPVLDGDPSTPALDPLEGDAYFAQPSAAGPPTNANPWRLFIAIEGGGVRVKLAGKTTIDQTTGQIKTLFENNPQTPFTRFQLKLHGGDRAILRNPLDCDGYTTEARLRPWSDPSGADFIPQNPESTFSISSGCPPDPKPFQPTIEATADPTQAGAYSTSRLVIQRPDGHRLIKKLSLSLPQGAVGSLAAVPLCSSGAAQTGACGEGSRIGSIATTVGTGAGLLDVTGAIYLGEPVQAGDAASIVIVIPAKVGPVDLGQVVVVNRVRLRQTDGGIDVESADIPTILGGIPLSVRRIEITVDREGFFLNPTGCDPRSFVATFTSDGIPSATATATATTQATGCESLPFSPRLRMIAGARGQTAKGAHPPLRAIVTQIQGEAAIAGTRVLLPDVLRPNLPQLQKPGALCQAADLAQGACSPVSKVGTAVATTPLLPTPLSGPIHLVVEPGQVLPNLAVLLGGAVSLRLDAKNAIEGVRTVNTFEGIPDVPVTSFELSITGGPSGILNAFSDLCDSRSSADATFRSHSGRSFSSRPPLEVEGCDRLVIASAAVRATRSGVVRIKLRCSAHGEDCEGRLSLQKARSRKRAARARNLGASSFLVPAGRTKAVRVKLTRSALRSLRGRKRVRVGATASVQGGVGPASVASRTIAIRAPKRS